MSFPRRSDVFWVLTLVVLELSWSGANLDPEGGVKCGQKRCPPTEYCSPYDTQCRPCSIICDRTSHNYQAEDCKQDCQEYLLDQRYVQREDLEREIRGLKTTVQILVPLVCFLLVGILFFVCNRFVKWNKLCDVARKTLGKRKWFKKATSCNKIKVDVESAPQKQQNGLRLSMPTISGMVAMESPKNSMKNGNSSITPSTSSTNLSRKVPSEDSTIEYVYDNHAMTPSPEVTQLRSKRESTI